MTDKMLEFVLKEINDLKKIDNKTEEQVNLTRAKFIGKHQFLDIKLTISGDKDEVMNQIEQLGASNLRDVISAVFGTVIKQTTISDHVKVGDGK